MCIKVWNIDQNNNFSNVINLSSPVDGFFMNGDELALTETWEPVNPPLEGQNWGTRSRDHALGQGQLPSPGTGERSARDLG